MIWILFGRVIVFTVRCELNFIHVRCYTCLNASQGRAMFQAAGHRPLTAEPLLQFLSVHMRYLVEKAAFGQGFLWLRQFCTVSIITATIQAHLHSILITRTSGRNLETLRKLSFIGESNEEGFCFSLTSKVEGDWWVRNETLFSI